MTASDYSPLTVRVSNKLRFGLEMLARAQNRSLSQAIEWALPLAWTTWELNSSGDTIGQLLDEVWKLDTSAERAMKIFESDPSLLDFEDRSAAILAFHCAEDMAIQYRIDHAKEYFLSQDKRESAAAQKAMVKEFEAWKDEANRWLRSLIIDNWEAIKVEAVRLQNQGKPLVGTALTTLLKKPAPKHLDIGADIKTLEKR